MALYRTIILIFISLLVMAPGKNYTPKDKKFGKSNSYSLEQEYRKGIREKPKYTRCRLKKRIKAKEKEKKYVTQKSRKNALGNR